MKNTDEAIDRVIAGLRNAEASPELEQRILRGLRGHAEVAPSAGWAWARASLRGFTLRPAALALILCVAGLSFLVALVVKHDSQRVSAVKPAVGGEAMRATGKAISLAQARQDRIAEKPAVTAAMGTLVSKVHPKSSAIPDTKSIAANSAAEARNDPAPPMPLTQQERLLLQLAHEHDTQSAALLNPMTEAQREAVEVAQFEDFFRNQKIEVKVEKEQQ